MSLEISSGNDALADKTLENIDRLAHESKGGNETLPPTPLYEVSNVSKASQPSEVGNLIVKVLHKYVGLGTRDLMIVALWILHTYTFQYLRTTPRLLITSILPESGKSTLMDWLDHLCYQPTPMASISSAPLLARLAAEGGTLLADEADRALRKDNPLTADFLAISNSGYKKGGNRPTLQPSKEGGWEAMKLSTWCPMAFAGNNPDLPDDTRSRCITLFLYPSESVEDTDWELIEPTEEYQDAVKALAVWANSDTVADKLSARPAMPDTVKGRAKEKWLPLARVAQTLSPYTGEDEPLDWLEVVKQLATDDVEQMRDDAAIGLRNSSPHTAVLMDIARLWATQWNTQEFVTSASICASLASTDPTAWGASSSFGTPITPKRLAGMLKKTGVNVTRNKDNTKRGYYFTSFHSAWQTLHIWESLETERITRPFQDTSAALDTLDTSYRGVSA